ncbi:hypothetical protein [Algirhabdus cladophorae]|uniref:hypothetical protein n=1 Tax=Algirhabdus cladophorae TaxID=3377108 RepID=UPI003B8459EE
MIPLKRLILSVGLFGLTACSPMTEPAVIMENEVLAEPMMIPKAVECGDLDAVSGDGIGGTGCPQP